MKYILYEYYKWGLIHYVNYGFEATIEVQKYRNNIFSNINKLQKYYRYI